VGAGTQVDYNEWRKWAPLTTPFTIDDAEQLLLSDLLAQGA